MGQVHVVSPVVLGVEVRDKHMDTETLHLKPDQAHTLPSPPVAMVNIVGVTIQRELLKHGLQHWKLAKDTSARPDDSLVKEVGVRQRISEI